MKKFTAIILAAILLTLTTSTAFAKTVYDSEKLHFVIVAEDEKTHETYVTTVTYKTAVKRILSGLVYEIYMLESDSIVPVDWTNGEGETITLVNRLTNEAITQ